MWGLATVRLLVPRLAISRQASDYPRANRAGVGVASGATKLVPAFLSGLAQCRKQCPLTIGGKVLQVAGVLLRLPLALPGIDQDARLGVFVNGVFVQDGERRRL